MLSDSTGDLDIVAVDFDNTLCTDNFPGVGIITPRHQKVIDFIRLLKAKGSKIMLYTCREDTEEFPTALTNAIKFCKDNDIPIDYVNENPNQDYKSRKPFFNILIDDKAISALNLDEDLELYLLRNTLLSKH